MKLRFRENTLRLRLNRREVEQLAAGGALREEIKFPGAVRLAYVLESLNCRISTASFNDGVMRVIAPLADIAAWAKSDDLGLYFKLPGDDAIDLDVAIEKDLECLDAPEIDRDPDAFARGSAKRC